LGTACDLADAVSECVGEVEIVVTGGAVQKFGDGDQFGVSAGGIEYVGEFGADAVGECGNQQAVAVERGDVVAGWGKAQPSQLNMCAGWVR
jgi:hypothetical protein